MKATITTLILTITVAVQLFAQQPFNLPTTVPGQLPGTDPTVDHNLLSQSNTPPPPPVRLMAEWEEAQALLVSWRNQHAELLREIIRHGSQECKVYVFVESVSQVTNYLQSGGVSLDNVELLVADYDSIWIRDYGPWTIYHNDVDSLMIADWRYNRPWREDDDKIPAFIADHMGLPVFEAADPPYRWVHTGGNNLRDGMGTIFASDLVMDENPGKTEAEIDELAHLFLGADRFVKFPKLPFDGISHVDMHMRFIDEETVFFGEYPEGVADGPQIEENIEYLQNEFLTPFGNTYNILRLPMPPDANDRYPDQNGDYRTYTNSLFINKTVLVPIYEEQYDSTALRIYQENLPGYNVVGIDCNDIITRLGAIHCITKLVGVADPLWIAHPRLRDMESTQQDYPTQAIIKHRSGIASANLNFRRQGDSDYTTVPMMLADSADARWITSIPAQPENTVVEYYIAAQANSGKQQVRPIVAPEGYFRFKVDALRPAFTPEQQTLCPDNSLSFANETEGVYDSIRWFFPGGTPATSTEDDPVVTYAESGVYDITLVAYGASTADTLFRPAAVKVKTLLQPYTEDFAADTAPSLWVIDNPDEDDLAWEKVDDISCDPGAMRIEHSQSNADGSRDFLRANFDLSGLTQPVLRFDLAYAQRASFLQDGLRINVVDCEGQKTTVFEQSGEELATAPSTPVPFVPEDCSQWRRETVALDAFTGQAIAIEFESISDYGNSLYIDLIEVGEFTPNSAPISLEEAGLSIRLFPNPVRERVSLNIISPKAGKLDWVLFNTLGQAMRYGTLDYFLGEQQLPLQVERLPAGLYKLQLKSAGSRSTYKLKVIE